MPHGMGPKPKIRKTLKKSPSPVKKLVTASLFGPRQSTRSALVLHRAMPPGSEGFSRS